MQSSARWHINQYHTCCNYNILYLDPKTCADVELDSTEWEIKTITSAIKHYLRYHQPDRSLSKAFTCRVSTIARGVTQGVEHALSAPARYRATRGLFLKLTLKKKSQLSFRHVPDTEHLCIWQMLYMLSVYGLPRNQPTTVSPVDENSFKLLTLVPSHIYDFLASVVHTWVILFKCRLVMSLNGTHNVESANNANVHY